MLTGEFADLVANNVGYLPIDNKTYQMGREIRH